MRGKFYIQLEKKLKSVKPLTRISVIKKCKYSEIISVVIDMKKQVFTKKIIK